MRGEPPYSVSLRITTTIIVQYIILKLHKAHQPQSEAFDTSFLTPYIIPILGLNRTVSSRLCRAFFGRDGDGRQDGRRPECFIPCLSTPTKSSFDASVKV